VHAAHDGFLTAFAKQISRYRCAVCRAKGMNRELRTLGQRIVTPLGRPEARGCRRDFPGTGDFGAIGHSVSPSLDALVMERLPRHVKLFFDTDVEFR
jgi:hypothetical protein